MLVYGPDGRALFVSNPLEATDPAPAEVLRTVLASGDTASFERDIAGQAVYSVLRPITRPDGMVAGAFEDRVGTRGRLHSPCPVLLVSSRDPARTRTASGPQWSYP